MMSLHVCNLRSWHTCDTHRVCSLKSGCDSKPTSGAQEEKVCHYWRDGAGRQRCLHQGREKTSSAIQIVHDDHEHGATLSGLLNFIDGLWSSCDSEHIVVLTTNHAEWLDPR
jgi:hypothetical protein